MLTNLEEVLRRRDAGLVREYYDKARDSRTASLTAIKTFNQLQDWFNRKHKCNWAEYALHETRTR